MRKKKTETNNKEVKLTAKSFYSVDPILKKAPDAKYYVIYGEKSNGKTFAVKSYAFKRYIEDGSQFVVIRRFAEDFKGTNGSMFWADMERNVYSGNLIEKWSKGKFNHIQRIGNVWYCQKVDEDGNLEGTTNKMLYPFAFMLSLATTEHNNTNAFPNVSTILFDEFISKSDTGYLNDEFQLFQIAISNIVRAKDDVKVFLCGNTFNRYCPYFTEMGLKHVKNQKKGSIDVYTYSNNNLKVAVEYSEFNAKSKPSDIYFAFDNPKLKMITSGDWALNFYPHLPENFKYDRKKIITFFFIVFDEEIFQCELMHEDNDLFIYCHKKTTPIKDDDHLVYQMEKSMKRNVRNSILIPWIDSPTYRFETLIKNLFIQNKVFYQDNDTGDTIANYIANCSPTTKVV